MSDKDFRGLEPGPVTALPRLPLSISESTASWSILFSFLTIMSGAPSSRSLLSLLFLLITLLYKSFKSDVANLPPSSWTIGLMSGGITGITSSIIHSGRLPDCLKASSTSRRFKRRMLFCPVASSSSARSSSQVLSRSISQSSFFIASAPMPASKSFSYFSRISRYCFSFKSCFFSSGVVPGSVTIYCEK